MKIHVCILAGLLCLPALAGSDRHEDYMKEVRAKETRRATDAAKEQGDIEAIEKKYGHLKEHHRPQYDDMIGKRKAAAREWSNVVKRVARAKDYEEVSAIKIPAYKAQAIAELARMELKAAGYEKELKHSVEKSGSDAVERVARKLMENDRKTIEATKDKMLKEHQLRELSLERGLLRQQMREEYEKAKEKARGREHDKRPDRKDDRKPLAKPETPKVRIE